MTLAEVVAAVERIRTQRYDSEAMHSAEDGLHQVVLQAIADGATNAQELAREALKTLGIEFERWCA